MAILGAGGLLNLVAGLVLLRRNHPVAWLTICPVLALCLPVFAIPFAGMLAERGTSPLNGILTFHRMLFAIPPGLALVVLGARVAGRPWIRSTLACPALLAAALAGFTLAPATGLSFNRFWHVLHRTPDDLALRGPWRDLAREAALRPRGTVTRAATPALDFLRNTQRPTRAPVFARTFVNDGVEPTAYLNPLRRTLSGGAPANTTVLTGANPTDFFTPRSFAALASRHWLPQETTLLHAGTRETTNLGSGAGMRATTVGSLLFLY
jgi:hypothetical protein